MIKNISTIQSNSPPKTTSADILINANIALSPLYYKRKEKISSITGILT